MLKLATTYSNLESWLGDLVIEVDEEMIGFSVWRQLAATVTLVGRSNCCSRLALTGFNWSPIVTEPIIVYNIAESVLYSSEKMVVLEGLERS